LSILSVSNISKTFDDLLFKSVTFEVNNKDKVGLVGANGTGKTTIFKIILDQLTADSGDVFIQKFCNIGYMKQHLNLHNERNIYTETLDVFSHLMQIEDKLENINHEISTHPSNLDALVKTQHTLQEKYIKLGGQTYASKTRAMLLGLGFSVNELEKEVSSLSGGEQTKVSLAKMLLSNADLLLLDEPTNHLDIESVEWLESYLSNYQRAFVVISHDRRFLDNVTNRTFDLSHGKLKVYKGNYSDYVKQKLLDEQQIHRDNKNIQREIDRINGIIAQQKRWNRQRNIKTAKSKQKVVDGLSTKLKQTQKEQKQMRLNFDADKRGGNEVVKCTALSKSFDDQMLFHDIDVNVMRGERVFLLGANGCGKSTLFKIILGSIIPDMGEAIIGANIFASYFDQTQANLDFYKTAFDNVSDAYPKMTETQIRNTLGTFLFSNDDAFKMVDDLSGGEKAKLSLLLLMLSKSNFLLLDEPTNHLDIASKQALQSALESYPGTLFIISHDRYLINDLADRVLYLSESKIAEYLGNYDYYLSKKVDEQSDKDEKTTKPALKNEYAIKKERNSKINRLNGQISRKEAEIMRLEADIHALENEMAKPEIATDHQKMMALTKQTEEKKQAEHVLYDELHVFEEALEGLTKEQE
jgi:ATP-binding cassette, subfamily F, member 3